MWLKNLNLLRISSFNAKFVMRLRLNVVKKRLRKLDKSEKLKRAPSRLFSTLKLKPKLSDFGLRLSSVSFQQSKELPKCAGLSLPNLRPRLQVELLNLKSGSGARRTLNKCEKTSNIFVL